MATARKVKQNAVPEVIKAIDNGHLSLNAAWKIADLPKAEKKKVMQDARPGVAVKKVARQKKEKALAFVISKNLARRHLNETQRSMVAASLAILQHGQRADYADTQICASMSQGDAAKKLSVSRRSVQTARKVKQKAVRTVTGGWRRGRPRWAARLSAIVASNGAEVPDC